MPKAPSIDALEVARLAAVLGTYEEAIGLIDGHLRLCISPGQDARETADRRLHALYDVRHRLVSSRNRSVDAYEKRRTEVALSGAINGAIAKQAKVKRTRRAKHPN